MEINAGTVRQAIQELELRFQADQLADDLALSKQGLDSLDFVNLLLHFEETHGIKLPDAEVKDVHTINEIVAMVNAKLAAKAAAGRN